MDSAVTLNNDIRKRMTRRANEIEGNLYGKTSWGKHGYGRNYKYKI